MSRSVDERIVEMRFDNKQFESGVKETLSTLNRLKDALDKNTSAKGLEDLDKAAQKIDMSKVAAGVEALSERFSTLGIIGMRVIENITDAVTGKLTGAVSNIFNTIVTRGKARAMAIENAHFQLQGLIDDEKEVQKIMDEASESVNGTAYAYDSAASAASMFAASGVKSGSQMENALKGIAGVAATANAEYESIANIFTTVAGQGKVMTDQLNQLATRGMNGAAALTKFFNDVNSGVIEVGNGVTEETAKSGNVTAVVIDDSLYDDTGSAVLDSGGASVLATVKFVKA